MARRSREAARRRLVEGKRLSREELSPELDLIRPSHVRDPSGVPNPNAMQMCSGVGVIHLGFGWNIFVILAMMIPVIVLGFVMHIQLGLLMLAYICIIAVTLVIRWKLIRHKPHGFWFSPPGLD
jgi:hypothetical protein